MLAAAKKNQPIQHKMSSNWLKLLEKQKKQSASTTKTKKKTSVKKNSKAVSIRTPLTKLAQQQHAAAEQAQKQRKPADSASGNRTGPLSSRQLEIGKYLAMDCEFVGVGPEGLASELARVSIVNFHGHTVYDQYVKPREKVTDWRTFVSGIRPSDMKNAISFKQAQTEVAHLLKDKILVGHAIHHDLEALYLTHPKRSIRDTSKHTPFKQKYSKGKTPSLKKLSAEILGIDIQGGEHSSVEDAKATMLIYKSDKKNFEKQLRVTHGS